MVWYHKKINLTYNFSIFDEIIEYAENTKWNRGIDKNGMIWGVEELSLSEKDFPILNEIFEGLNAEFKRKSFFLSSVLEGGLVNHIDHRKWGNLAFPLKGSFSNTPQYFFDQFNHPVEYFILDRPTLFNTRMTHGVPKYDSTPRWVLMMDIFEWPDNLFKKEDIWTDTLHFKYNK